MLTCAFASRIKKGEFQTCNGVSFLEVQYQLMLSYCINIAYYLYLKVKTPAIPLYRFFFFKFFFYFLMFI